jgi:GR25 family glycosyltransferase involved in LPS biosynthesis
MYIKMSDLPKIFCLTLKDTPKRREYAEQHFKQHGLDVTFFEGVNAKTFGLRTVIPFMDNILFHNPSWKPGDNPPEFITQGHVGCILSHYMLWKTISHLPDEEYLIFEDDVVLCDGFKDKLLDYKSRLPNDWQYVFVGYCCLPDESCRYKHIDNIYTTSHPPLCTHAYMIKKESTKVLIETNSVAWAHIDIQIQKRTLWDNKLKYYVFLPPLADQTSLLKQTSTDVSIDKDNIFNSLTLNSNSA